MGGVRLREVSVSGGSTVLNFPVQELGHQQRISTSLKFDALELSLNEVAINKLLRSLLLQHEGCRKHHRRR